MRAFILSLALASSRATFIDNLSPRLDSTGQIMDSHDFSLHRYPGFDGYYMVSIAYGECKEPANLGCDQTPDKCGFQANHTINVWHSLDLSSGSWTFVTAAVTLDNRPPGTIFRPDAIWNPHTQQVVLWFNWLNAAGVYEGYAAYTAPSPLGPFTRQRASVNTSMQNATESCGDFHLFIDPADQTPYVIAGCGFHMWIERLLPNMLDSAGDTSPAGRYLFSEYFIEAPALFYRGGLYYAVFGHCCCYCMQGSGAIVHTAPHPLGPWTSLGDVACVALGGSVVAAAAAITPLAAASRREAFLSAVLGPSGSLDAKPTPGQGCQYVNASTTSALRAQQSDIFAVDLANGTTAWIWAGDRWQQAPDGLKAHDPQTWVPLEFLDDGSVAPLRFLDNFSLPIV